MKPQLSENHPSYQNHRRQFWLQIFLPMILAVLFIIIVVAVISGVGASGQNGEIPRWAAITTIWLIILIMFFGLLLLVILSGLIYLLARTLNILPPYSSQAQYYVNRGASEVKRFSDMAAKPVLFIEGIIASLKAIFRWN